jgi:type IV secretion system protein TrbL
MDGSGICNVPVISTVCDVAGQAAGTLVQAPFEWLAQAISGAAAWLYQGIWWFIDQTTLVDLTTPGYLQVYNLIFGVAVFLTLGLAMLQLIGGMVRRDPHALTTAGIGIARSILGSFLIVTVTGTLLEITDQLSIGIVQATGTSMDQMSGRITALVAGLTITGVTAPGAGAIITIFLGSLAIVGAFLIFSSLLIRKALLLATIALGPLAMAGQSWEVTRGWFGKWAMFVLALILSKFVVVVVLLVGVAEAGAPLDPDLSSLANPLAGIVLVFIAAFAPYMVYKLLAFIGIDMYHAMSTEQEAKQAMNRPFPTMQSPKANPSSVLGGGKGGGGSAGPGDAPAPDAAGGGVVGGGGDAAAGGGAAAAEGAGAGAGAAAAGPAAAAIIGAEVVKAAATAGPNLGGAIGGAAEQEAGGGLQQVPPPPAGGTVTPPPTPPSSGRATPPLEPPATTPA